MTKTKIEPDRILCNFLRKRVFDLNTTRSAAGNHFIMPDFPRISNIGDSDFPRVGITLISENGTYLGIFDNTQTDSVIVQIDVVTKKGVGYTKTVTDEALGTMSSSANSNRFTFDYIPTAVTNIKHNGTGFGTVTQKNTDDNFTAPGSLAAGTVEYSYGSGNLNFSSADVASYDGQAITSTYTVYLEGKNQTQWIAREIVKAIRNYWRTDMSNALFYPEKINNNPIPFDENLGLFRQVLEYKFKMFNAGEGI